MYADFNAIQKQLKYRIANYKFNLRKEPSVEAIAQLTSYTLYMKRSFPYYTFNLVCGLDQNDNGIVYGYDAVGSYNVLPYGCQGSAQQLIAPLLDNQLQGYNKKVQTPPASLKELEEFVVDCFESAAERDIYCGK